MLHQRITRTEEERFDRVFREAVPIVRQLAGQRAKPWPKLLVHRQRHQARISDLESELLRVANRIDWTPAELEKVVRAEIKRRGRFVPAARPAPIVASKEQLEADLAVVLARENVKETERLIATHQERLVKQQIDLSRKREAARLLRVGSAAQ